MARIDRQEVMITGNIARFNPEKPYCSNQNQNIDWLYHIVVPHIESLGWKSAGSVKWAGNCVKDNNIYRLLNLECNLENYLAVYSGAYNNRLSDHLRPVFQSALVVGFEIPPFLIQMFDEWDVPYIDVILGPIRFFPDLVPALRSNVKEVVEKLDEYRLNDHMINAYASWRQAYFAKQELKEYQASTLLVVGQTRHDTSQISDSRFVELIDFENKIMQMGKGRKLLFKPHPYASTKDTVSQSAMMKKLGADVTHDNIYRLLCSSGIDEVATISSSVAIEAPYFGCEAETLIEYPFSFAAPDERSTGKFYNIYGQLSSTEFWSHILNAHRVHDVVLPVGGLAWSLGQKWGADAFDDAGRNDPQGLLHRLSRRFK